MKSNLDVYEDEVLRIAWSDENNRWHVEIKFFKDIDSVKRSMDLFKMVSSYMHDIE